MSLRQPQAQNDFQGVAENLRAVMSRVGVLEHAKASPWRAPTLLNSWANYEAAGTFATAEYSKDGEGFVYVRGLVKEGVNQKAIFLLPQGFRPAKRLIFAVNTAAGLGRIDIAASGEVYPEASSVTWTNLTGIVFQAEG